MVTYNPRFLSWCKGYEQEVSEFERLIEGNPNDVELLKDEYEQLTGYEYRSQIC